LGYCGRHLVAYLELCGVQDVLPCRQLRRVLLGVE